MPTNTTVNSTGEVVTTDASPSSIVNSTLPENSSAILQVEVVARRASNGNTKTWLMAFTAKRQGSGAAQVVDAPVNIISPLGDLGALTWDINITDGGSDVGIEVKGQSNATIQWFSRMTGLVTQS